MVRHLVLLLLVLLVALVRTPTLGAQTTITLEGVVVNDAGKPVENVRVTVVDSIRNESRTALTRANGEFRFLGLTSGRYAVTARYIGFRPTTEAVQLVLGQRARI